MQVTSHSFGDHADLVDFLSELAVNEMRGKLTVMAGHFMLIYRHSAQVFVPLMPSVAFSADGTVGEQSQVELRGIGNFPEASFEMGVQLVRARGEAETKIALLVNDHQFLLFQENLPPRPDVGRIRRQFFHNNVLPPHFAATAARYGLDDSVFEENNAERGSDSSLPSRGVYYSENVLRNHMRKRHKRDWLLGHEGFERKLTLSGESRIVYRFPDGRREICLVDEQGACGCFGEIVEFLLAIERRGARNLIMFVPNECREPVQAAIEASICSLTNFEMVIGVWGGAKNDEASTDGLFRKARFSSLTTFLRSPRDR